MVRKEVISIHVGQTGLQAGIAMWELYLIEHDLNVEGSMNDSFDPNGTENHQRTFFYEANNNRFVPRALLIDSESNVIDDIKTGIFRNLFNPAYIVCGIDDGANNFARGSFCLGNKHLQTSLNCIRKQVEKSDMLQGFMLNHSLGGGTGSGLTSVLMHALSLDYTDKAKFQTQVYPGSRLSSSIVEPYNATLHIHSTMESSDMAFLVDNQSLYSMCKQLLHIYSPYYSHINRLLGVIKSSITSTMRFGNPVNADMRDLQTNLVPFPRVHFPIISHAPVVHRSRESHSGDPSITKILESLFKSPNLTLKLDLHKGRYMAVLLVARGQVSVAELRHSLKIIKHSPDVGKFVEWSPNGVKVTVNHQIPLVVPDSEMGVFNRSISMISNNTALKQLWNEMGRKFDLLFNKRAYLHWYIDEGMEESEFTEARMDIATLWEDYEEISMTVEEIELELIDQSSRMLRYSSQDRSETQSTDHVL